TSLDTNFLGPSTSKSSIEYLQHLVILNQRTSRPDRRLYTPRHIDHLDINNFAAKRVLDSVLNKRQGQHRYRFVQIKSLVRPPLHLDPLSTTAIARQIHDYHVLVEKLINV